MRLYPYDEGILEYFLSISDRVMNLLPQRTNIYRHS